jgi:hypothetical protein
MVQQCPERGAGLRGRAWPMGDIHSAAGGAGLTRVAIGIVVGQRRLRRRLVVAPITTRLARAFLEHKADLGVPIADDAEIVARVDEIKAHHGNEAEMDLRASPASYAAVFDAVRGGDLPGRHSVDPDRTDIDQQCRAGSRRGPGAHEQAHARVAAAEQGRQQNPLSPHHGAFAAADFLAAQRVAGPAGSEVIRVALRSFLAQEPGIQ